MMRTLVMLVLLTLGTACATTNGGGGGGGAEAMRPSLPHSTLQLGTGIMCGSIGEDLRCWGKNDDGALGDGTKQDRPEPTRVVGLPPKASVVSLAAAADDTCALLSDGTVWCWGTFQNVPKRQTGISGATTLVYRHHNNADPEMCALDRAGTVRCWFPRGEEAPEVLNPRAQGLFATLEGLCFHDPVKGLVCDFQLDYPAEGSKWDSDDEPPEPVTDISAVFPLPPGKRVLQVSGHYGDICVLLEGGQVMCRHLRHWHYTVNAPSPEPHELVFEEIVPSGVKALAVGGPWGACTVEADSTVRCWKKNSDPGWTWEKVPMLGPVVALTGDWSQTCALSLGAAPAVTCWQQSTDRLRTVRWRAPVAPSL